MKGAGIYIHIPFCKRKCYYCDFNSFSADDKKIEDYIKALLKEISLYKSQLSERKIRTIFIGGGTPSILDGEKILEISEALKANCDLSYLEEFTIEANPGTVDLEKLLKYREAGINRISFGVQSFNDEILKAIGRIHSSDEAVNSIELARKAGFQNINIDLMYNLPGQSVEDILDAIEKAASLDVEHISLYSLIIEENTKFFDLFSTGKLKLMSEDEEREAFAASKEILKDNGYERYEISNYSKSGKKSAHNLIYWNNEEYFGFGLGSHGRLENTRYSNEENFKKYIEIMNTGEFPVKERNKLNKEDNIFESIMLGFRLCDGVNIKELDEMYGISAEEYYKEEIKKFMDEGMLEIKDGRIFLNEKGLDISNYILAHFMK